MLGIRGKLDAAATSRCVLAARIPIAASTNGATMGSAPPHTAAVPSQEGMLLYPVVRWSHDPSLTAPTTFPEGKP